jgi:hypothetical protein
MMPPFVGFCLPRSRSRWLSRYLSYGGWHCGHDEERHCRSLDDVRSWLAQPCTGTIETAGAAFWRLLQQMRPDVRVVVVRRPVPAVVDSLERLGFERAAMLRLMRAQDAKLDQIETRMPGVLSVPFPSLDTEEGCARVFRHCLGEDPPPGWWEMLAPLNLQDDIPALVRYATAYAAQLERLRSIAAHKSLQGIRRQAVLDIGGVAIRQEPFDAYLVDGAWLRGDQYGAVDEAPEYRHQVNYGHMRLLADAGALMTTIARRQGRVVGWLLTLISPSLDDARITSAYHTSFFASPAYPGLGLRLAISANEAAVARGCGEIIGRAGLRGDGPRLGLLWQLLGAEPCGQLYRMTTGA